MTCVYNYKYLGCDIIIIIINCNSNSAVWWYMLLMRCICKGLYGFVVKKLIDRVSTLGNCLQTTCGMKHCNCLEFSHLETTSA